MGSHVHARQGAAPGPNTPQPLAHRLHANRQPIQPPDATIPGQTADLVLDAEDHALNRPRLQDGPYLGFESAGSAPVTGG